MDEGNLYDPNKKGFDLEKAIEALGLSEDEMAGLRDRVALDLLLAHAGITQPELDLALSQRIKALLAETAENLRSLADY